MTIRNGLFAAAVTALAGSALMAAPTVLHVHLARSDPAAGGTVRVAPAAIRLWFSGEIQINVTTVRVTGPDSTALDAAAPAMGDGEKPPVMVVLRGTMKPGRQQVAWRTMSRDGHAERGTFVFTLAPGTAAAARR